MPHILRTAISALVFAMTALPAYAAGELPLASDSWYIVKASSHMVMGCKNPSFVETANRMAAAGTVDTMNNYGQEGCTPVYLPGQPDPAQSPLKIVRTLDIDGGEIIEVAQPMYIRARHAFRYFNLFVRRADLSAAPVRAPTLAEVMAAGL